MLDADDRKETQQQDPGAFLYTTRLSIGRRLYLSRSISLVESEGSPGTPVFSKAQLSLTIPIQCKRAEKKDCGKSVFVMVG